MIALLIVVLAVYVAFVHKYPWTNPYELKAVFANANNLAQNSPVRVAGVTVGKVTGIETKKGSTASVVKMALTDDALPIHQDATLKIRPRIFLEGNFFVDLKPGSAETPEISSSAQIPVTQTASPVQIDQVLSVLQGSARQGAQQLIQGYGDALSGKPTLAQDALSDPSTKGLTGAQALNASLDNAVPALKNLSVVNQALLGTEPHDLSKLIVSVADVSTILSRHEGALQGLITNFNTTMGAFASQSTALGATIHILPEVLANADKAFASLNGSFPPLRQFATDILPGVNETAATINASFPWIAQTGALMSPNELQGLVKQLQPTVANLADVTDKSLQLFPQVDLVSRCLSDVILPTGDVVLKDPPLSTGVANYKEFWQTMVGLSGESQNFDGNGQMTRFQTGGGSNFVSTGSVGGAAGSQQFGNAIEKPIGTRPARPAVRPPYNRAFACYKNPLPNLNDADIGAGP
ncbi:MAG: phospholipid/cholesterol/gamma-HCH transport system substrate-binding protein [Thermoleophilaceae bacterium]|jgi:virulence factor Mce-like protein|nr:phospholipid/cholesterol/gamma-HCH transport system substrate-binding protein [Thermoleophilaceae bacterium]